jgi:hypothetical protein
MIDETQLSFQRGTLVEFSLHLGGGTKTCRGLVLNTAVFMGKGARQVWILDMDDPTPQLESQWTKTMALPRLDVGKQYCTLISLNYPKSSRRTTLPCELRQAEAHSRPIVAQRSALPQS